ncbi:type II toxin-antitoxin system VapC family toxin [Phormidesmis priestleyi]
MGDLGGFQECSDSTIHICIQQRRVDEPIHRAAVELLIARQDKTYSLCDAVSFILMHQRGVTEALTTDRHFEQEGFVRLLQLAC